MAYADAVNAEIRDLFAAGVDRPARRALPAGAGRSGARYAVKASTARSRA